MPKIFDVIAEIESFGTRKERRFIFLTIFSLTIIFSIVYKQATGKDLASSFVVLLITLAGLFMGVFLLYAAFVYPKRDVKRYERLIARYIEDRKSTKIAIFFIFLAVLFFIGLGYVGLDIIKIGKADTLTYIFLIFSFSATFFFICWDIFLIKALRYSEKEGKQ